MILTPKSRVALGDPVCVTGDGQKREKSRLLLSASLLLFCFSLTFSSGKDLSTLLSQHPRQLFLTEFMKAGVQGLEQAAMNSRRKRRPTLFQKREREVQTNRHKVRIYLTNNARNMLLGQTVDTWLQLEIGVLGISKIYFSYLFSSRNCSTP